MATTYSIIIPAYNEGERLGATLDRVLDFLRTTGWTAEVLVVDDGSTDSTADLVRRYAAQHPQVHLLQNPGNRGKGYSVRHGMLEATGQRLLFTDADLSAPIAEAPKLFARLAAGADLAIGSRWLDPALQTERQPLYRQFFGRLFNLLLRLILGLRFRDTQCGFKAFTRRAAQLIFSRQRIERWGFDPELLFLAARLGLKVEEVPVEWANDPRTKIRPLRDGARIFSEMLRIRWYSLTGKYAGEMPAGPQAGTK
jgi:glycosyltransferase involved in cell wall biosynthesis